MDKNTTISQLKALLIEDVSSLCQYQDGLWNKPIVQVLQDIRKANIRAVFFGGTLRSLLLSRLQDRQLGRPRDIDIVVADKNLDVLRERFHSIIARETRFGGLQLKYMDWQFDIWSLHRTWAFLEDGIQEPHFSLLPSTTFFNLEAIAVDIWDTLAHARAVYSGDDQFFQGILSRTLEINREKNPFPSLCVVRAFVMASSTGFAIGPHLAYYLTLNGSAMSDAELEEIQMKHYGRIYCQVSIMREWLEYVESCYTHDNHSPIILPSHKPLISQSEMEAEPSQINSFIPATS